MENPAPGRRNGTSSWRSASINRWRSSEQPTFKCGIRRKTARREAKRRVMSSPSSSISESFHQGYVMRLFYFTIICPTQLKRPIKSLLGNMTHVVRSFQLLHYSNKQLLFVTSKPPFLPSPADNGVGSNLFLKRQNSIVVQFVKQHNMMPKSDFCSDDLIARIPVRNTIL